MKVLIYGRDSCKFCNKAKQLAEFCKENLEGFEYIIDYNEGKGWQAVALSEKLGFEVKSVPQIFVDGRHLGGYTEFDAWLRNEIALNKIDFKREVENGERK